MTPEAPDNNRVVTNAGRCVVCGKPIDMKDAGHELVVMESVDIDEPGFTPGDAQSAIAQALRREGSPESHSLADAYEDDREIIMHSECHDQTAMPELYGTSEVGDG